MNIKVIFAALFMLLVGFIGYNNYSSYQKKERAEARAAETEVIRTNNAQAIKQPELIAAPVEPNKSEPTTQNLSGDELAAANKAIIDAANKEMSAATNSRYAADEASKKKICYSVISISKTAMKARQDGVGRRQALAMFDSANDGSDAAAKISKIPAAIVSDAYLIPRYNTYEFRNDAIKEFALANYLACINSVAKW